MKVVFTRLYWLSSIVTQRQLDTRGKFFQCPTLIVQALIANFCIQLFCIVAVRRLRKDYEEIVEMNKKQPESLDIFHVWPQEVRRAFLLLWILKKFLGQLSDMAFYHCRAKRFALR
jgi:hypothetical protein